MAVRLTTHSGLEVRYRWQARLSQGLPSALIPTGPNAGD